MYQPLEVQVRQNHLGSPHPPPNFPENRNDKVIPKYHSPVINDIGIKTISFLDALASLGSMSMLDPSSEPQVLKWPPLSPIAGSKVGLKS